MKEKKNDFIMLPTVDFCFKELMQNPTVRQGFIAALLGVPPEEVAETVLLPTLLSGDMPEEKTGILDVHIRLSSGAQMDMEMQVSYFPHWEKRVLFYLGRMYTGQLKKGESYTDLKKCIHVSILDFNHFPDDQECYRTMHFRNDLTGDLYTDLLEIQVLELRKPLPSSRGQNTVSDWIEFLRGKNREELRRLSETNKYLGEAYETLEKLSADERKRLEYEAREKALHDYNTIKQYYREEGLEEGLEKGIEIGRGQGFQEGQEQGFQEGQEQGLERGIKIGQEQTRQVFRLHMAGKSPAEIAEACQLTEDKVREILEGILEG